MAIPKYLQDLIRSVTAGPQMRPYEPFPYMPETTLNRRTQQQLDMVEAPVVRGLERERGAIKHNYELQADKAKGLGEAFLSILTGGKTGAEAEAFSKAQFGGSYLGAQAMQISADLLREATREFNEKDWEISANLADFLQDQPARREQIRNELLALEEKRAAAYDAGYEKEWEQSKDKWDRDYKLAGFLMNEYRKDWAIEQWKQEFGLKTRAQTAREKNTAADNRLAQQREKRMAKNTAADNASARKNTLLTEARDLTNATGLVHVVRNGKVVNTGKRKAKGGSGQGGADMVADVARDVMKLRSEIVPVPIEVTGRYKEYAKGKYVARDDAKGVFVLPAGGTTIRSTNDPAKAKTSGGMAWDQAREYIYGFVAEALRQAGYNEPMIRRWIDSKLVALGLRPPRTKPRRGGGGR